MNEIVHISNGFVILTAPYSLLDVGGNVSRKILYSFKAMALSFSKFFDRKQRRVVHGDSFGRRRNLEIFQVYLQDWRERGGKVYLSRGITLE